MSPSARRRLLLDRFGLTPTRFDDREIEPIAIPVDHIDRSVRRSAVHDTVLQVWIVLTLQNHSFSAPRVEPADHPIV